MTASLIGFVCVIAATATASFAAGIIAGLGWGFLAGMQSARAELTTWTSKGDIAEA